MSKVLCFFLLFLGSMANHASADDDFIEVIKKGVLYRFVKVDAHTDCFSRDMFPDWENETFDVFEQVKDDQSIAIDLGAWIGATAVWLSHNFRHVVAVEADRISLNCLGKNLAASDCPNVVICEKPVMHTTKEVIFGPRGSSLNQSVSYIKKVSDNPNDYTVQSTTFKQLVYDYVYANKTLSTTNISFIKCDIEGGEENILEDVLHFAYYNNCKVYMSFHLSWWQKNNIDQFANLFSYFKTNCPTENVVNYIKSNPFCSLLFEPRPDAGVLVKDNITAVIIGYNQPTFIKNMVTQLEKYTSDIIIIDNNSYFPPLLDYYANEFPYTLLRQNENFGHEIYRSPIIKNLIGDVYVLTDPDLEFNPLLPDDFLKTFLDISRQLNAYKVGFALRIDTNDIRTDVTSHGRGIKAWEQQFWKNRLTFNQDPNLELYQAPIDTTFCLINDRHGGCEVRVAGNYTCKHIPWHIGFQNNLLPGEYDAYLDRNRSTNWFKVTLPRKSNLIRNRILRNNFNIKEGIDNKKQDLQKIKR